MATRIMIIAGEASGDLHGSALVNALRERQPDVEMFGVGGDRMQRAGMELIYHVEDLAFMGFSEVVKHLGEIRRKFYHLLDVVKDRQPDILVLVDYPGFNLRFGKKVKQLGVPVFYFIAPQVWAWHQSRAKTMATFVDRMAVLFEFEVDFFQKYGLETHFVGHPLLDSLNVKLSRDEFYQKYDLPFGAPVLALFAGSRKQEIDTLLPPLLQTAQQLKAHHPDVQIAVSRAATIPPSYILPYLDGAQDTIALVDDTYELIKYAQAAIVKSGTSTLETAIFETPFLIVYKVSPLSYAIGKRVVKIPFIGLANIVAGEQVAKEFIQNDVTAESLLPEVERCMFDETYRQEKVQKMRNIKKRLGEPGAAEKTAELILQLTK